MTTENNFTEASLDNFSWDDLNINMEDLVNDTESTVKEPTQPNQPSEIEPTKQQEEENLEEVDLNKTEETKKEESKPNDITPSNEGNEHQTSVPTNKVEELPQTGTGNEFEIFGAAASSILASLGFVIKGKRKKE